MQGQGMMFCVIMQEFVWRLNQHYLRLTGKSDDKSRQASIESFALPDGPKVWV